MVDPLIISRSSQCMTGVTKTVVCAILCGMVHIKEPLLLIRKSSSCGSGFHLSLSEWSFTIFLTPYNSKQNLLSALLNKTFPSFLAHFSLMLTFSPNGGMMHIKEPLLLIRKSSPCGSGFHLSLSEWSFTIFPTSYNSK